MKPKYYRTEIKVVVLSEEPYEFESLENTAYHITDGDCSGEVSIVEANKELTGPEMARALQDQGSDPEFFQLDASGNDLSEEN